jgi:hypothetical protein
VIASLQVYQALATVLARLLAFSFGGTSGDVVATREFIGSCT